MASCVTEGSKGRGKVDGACHSGPGVVGALTVAAAESEAGHRQQRKSAGDALHCTALLARPQHPF